MSDANESAAPRDDAAHLLRCGADKVAVLLDSVLAGLPAATSVVCVGPPRPTRRSDVRWVREEPPLAGPLAAVFAGLACGSAPTVLLTAADMPRVGFAVPSLLAALESSGGWPPIDGAVLVDSDGRAQVLASVWRRERLAAALASIALDRSGSAGAAPGVGPALVGRPLRLLLQGTVLAAVSDGWDAGRDIDAPQDLD